MPGITMRFNSATAALKPLGGKFFKATKVEVKKKLDTSSTLLMSKAYYLSGSWPTLTLAENRLVHSRTMKFFRSATGEKFSDDVNNTNLTDAQLLVVHELRAPATFIRFSRLRLSVRIALRAPLALLSLLVAASKDAKSWFKAFEADLEWLGKVDTTYAFTSSSWFQRCRTDPKYIRKIIRAACDSSKGSDIGFGVEASKVSKIIDTCTCNCGATFRSKAALGIHRFHKHGYRSVVSNYADSSCQCRVCLTQFDNLQILKEHLGGSRLCLLNLLLRVPPLSPEDLDMTSKSAAAIVNKNVEAGLPKFHVTNPPLRASGPLWRLIDINGVFVDESDPLHPWGKGRQKRQVADCV